MFFKSPLPSRIEVQIARFGVIWAICLISCIRDENSAGQNQSIMDLLDLPIVSQNVRKADSIYSEMSNNGHWNLLNYRPDTLITYFLGDSTGIWAKVWQLIFPEEYLAYGFLRNQLATEKSQTFFSNSNNEIFIQYQKSVLGFSQIISEDYFQLIQKKIGEKVAQIGLPGIFATFPVEKRVPGGARVIPRNFLAISGIGETIGMEYYCFHETALLFRSFHPHHQNSSQGEPFSDFKLKEIEPDHFWGRTNFGTPVYLVVDKWGFLGVLNCSDLPEAENLAKKAQKMSNLMP